MIDLSLVPAPQVVEPLDYETIISDLLTSLRIRDPNYTAIVESDPAYKLLEVAAYEILTLRQRINDASRASMLAYAVGTDLDNLAAFYAVTRLLIATGNPDAIPPIPDSYEDDKALRARTRLALYARSNAGPANAYKYHALSSDSAIHDVSITSPVAGDVLITVLARTGTASQALLDIVFAAVNAEDVRPLNDAVTVQAATVIDYQISAKLFVYAGPDANVILVNAQASIQAYVDSMYKIGFDIQISAIYGALHVSGVQHVELTTPQTIIVDQRSVANCTNIDISITGVDQ